MALQQKRGRRAADGGDKFDAKSISSSTPFAYLDELLRPVVHLVVPLYVGHDAGHVHLALEGGALSGARRHVVHRVLDVGLAARLDWKREEVMKSSRQAPICHAGAAER